MDFIKNFLSGKKPGWYVSLAAFVLGLVTLIVYTARGGNYLSPVDAVAVTMIVLGIVTNIAVLVKDFKIGAFLPIVFYAIAVAVLLNTEMLFITNVIFGVDGNYFDGAFFTFLVTLGLALICAAVAFGMGLSKKAVKD